MKTYIITESVVGSRFATVEAESEAAAVKAAHTQDEWEYDLDIQDREVEEE